MRALILITFVFGVVYGELVLKHSHIYDEFDFNDGTGTKNIQFCSGGCRVYVSFPEASREIAKNIVVDRLGGAPKISIVDIPDNNLEDGQLGFFEYKSAQFDIINQNPHLEVAPLLIYIVEVTVAHNADAEVYEASGYSRPPSTPGVITILSAEPYTLISSDHCGAVVTAQATGYDNIDDDSEDKCDLVFSKDSDDGFFVQVNSPLFTMKFTGTDCNPQISQSVVNGAGLTLDLHQTNFIMSPGYLGCRIDYGQRTYRSSLYPANFAVTATAPATYHIEFFAELDVSRDAVHITDLTTGIKTDYSGTYSTGSHDQTFSMDTNGIQVDWEYDQDSSFMIRYVPDQTPAAVDTTSTAPTTTEPVETTPTTTVSVETTPTTTEPVETTQFTNTTVTDVPVTESSTVAFTTESSTSTDASTSAVSESTATVTSPSTTVSVSSSTVTVPTTSKTFESSQTSRRTTPERSSTTRTSRLTSTSSSTSVTATTPSTTTTDGGSVAMTISGLLVTMLSLLL